MLQISVHCLELPRHTIRLSRNKLGRGGGGGENVCARECVCDL
jgi:hypothetical protein